MKLFFSFKFGENENFLRSLATKLQESDDPNELKFDVYFDPADRRIGKFQMELQGEINTSAALIFFVGRNIGPTQNEELAHAFATEKTILPVYLPAFKAPGPLSIAR